MYYETSRASFVSIGQWGAFYKQCFGRRLSVSQLLRIRPFFWKRKVILIIRSVDQTILREFIRNAKYAHIANELLLQDFDTFFSCGKGKKISLTHYLLLCMKNYDATGKLPSKECRFYNSKGFCIVVSTRIPDLLPKTMFVERFRD